jgi:hypothetical protein
LLNIIQQRRCQRNEVRRYNEKKNRFLHFKKQENIKKIVCLDTDYDDDRLETFKRYKPRSLDELASRTKFSKKEIQLIYQGFKQECPSGMNYFF